MIEGTPCFFHDGQLCGIESHVSMSQTSIDHPLVLSAMKFKKLVRNGDL